MPNLIRTFLKLAAGRLGALIVAVSAGSLFVIPVGSYYTRDHHGLGERVRDAERDLQLRATLLENLLKQVLVAPELLIAGVAPAAVTSPEPWEAPARRILKANGIISRLEIVPEGRPGLKLVRDDFASNSTTLTARQWPALAGQRGSLASQGQAIVSANREAFVAKQAVQLLHANGQSQPWGHVLVTADLADLSRIMRLDELAALGYSIRLDYFQEGVAGGQHLAAAGGGLRENAFSHEIRLAQGDRIHLPKP